jgi:hypothetical protein
MTGRSRSTRRRREEVPAHLDELEVDVIIALAKGATNQEAVMADLGPRANNKEGELAQVLRLLEVEGLLVMEEGGKERVLRLPISYSILKRVFHRVERVGRSAELMHSPWFGETIGEEAIGGITQDLVFASIWTVLRLLTSSHDEVEADPFLSDMERYLIEDEESYLSLGGISGVLDEIAFIDFLQFGLGDAVGEDREIRKQEILEQMAERDIALFFDEGSKGIRVAEDLKLLLFPPYERGELFTVLRSSPSALRVMLSARETRAGSFIAASTIQVLPLLERLFHLFAEAQDTCDERRKEMAENELSTLVEYRLRTMPRPSPLLKVLKGRLLADSLK